MVIPEIFHRGYGFNTRFPINASGMTSLNCYYFETINNRFYAGSHSLRLYARISRLEIALAHETSIIHPPLKDH